MSKFESIFGQDTVVRTLRAALAADSLAGAYLIVGADGTGKLAVAQTLAQTAACLDPRAAPFDSCGRCESCLRAETGTNPDIVTIRPAGEQLQIWQLWDRQGRQAPGILSRTLSFAPVIGRRRVYILEKADRLTEPAANSLLKSLEEPPPYALFLLLAPHPARVLPTIVSRCQIVRLGAVPKPVLSAYLRETVDADVHRAATIAAYSEGRIGQAITLAADPAVGTEIMRILDYAETLPRGPAHRALRSAEQLRKLAAQTKALAGEEPIEPETPSADSDPGGAREKTGRKQFAAVLDLLVTFYRDLLALRVGAQEDAVVHRDRLDALERLYTAGSPERWTACLDSLLLARRRLDANANTSLVTEVLLMRLLESQ